MQFNSLAAFLDMGGYGFFVWLSYGISALSIMLMVLYMRHERRSLIQAVKAQVARKQRIAEAKKIQEQ
ncbi:MAG: heme exporter protein CcmD [Glaciecola sp.]|jgi:heme exporter protein D|uniref:heme exporter protein CcmD n=1 Tax=Glaciecola sp. HTCC2999 TaxID=455436 RepID=UPI0000E0E5AD|nr:heme exporter protein CcmD [Glaciecola sp. HTCC2999]